VVFEQPGGVVAELLAERAVLHDLAIQRLVGLVHVAGRRGLEAEGNVAHHAVPVFVLFGASLAGFALCVRLPRSPDDFGRLMDVEVDLLNRRPSPHAAG